MIFNEKEIETVKNLINDFGFEYNLVTKIEDVKALAKKLNMDYNSPFYDDQEDN
ncbi:MAG TPA: hypothetical protein PLN40_10180 [Agitococcus sp.]|nr:hypothetical protein [Agitococcus sp.]HNB01944.1 hypothetical protein [Nitrosomonas sp.]